MNALYDRDANLSLLADKTIAVIGYGSQGRAHSRNLHDSGVKVVVGLRDGSQSAEIVRADGLESTLIAEAVRRADVVMILAPDEEQAATYVTEIAPNLKSGAVLAFAHGFAVHFGTIVPAASLPVVMIAPKGPGWLVRREYEDGRGVPCLIAVARDPHGDARALALAYASAIGGGRAGILETTFKEECETDLFGEQAVLCGGTPDIVRAGFETLVEAGYAPEMAYFEVLHELKLIVDLMYERGIDGMYDSISNTAKYGSFTRGPRVSTAETKETMRTILKEIQSGAFAQEWVAEHAAGKPKFDAYRATAKAHPIEDVGRKLRGLMPWMQKTAPGAASRN